MDLKSNMVIYAIIGILVVVVLILGAMYALEQGDKSLLRTQVDELSDEVDNKTSLLTNSELLREVSEDFSEAYFSGWGTYYVAREVEDTAWVNYNKADGYYDVGNWYSAVGYYDESVTYFLSARSQYQDALDWFEVAANTSLDTVWVNLSQQCISLMDSKMKAMTFLREVSELMEDTCDAYLDGSYDAAHNYYDEAQTKYGYYEDQMDVFAGYEAFFADILAEYVS